MAHQITPYLPEYDAEPTLDPNSDAEREVGKVLDAPASEQIRFLLDKVVENDQWEQRSNDVDGDHGIALFARQKRQSLARILQAFFMLSFVYVVQLVVIYNLGRFSLQISSDRMLQWVERKQWSNYKVSHNTSFTTNDLSTIITTTFGRYTISFLDLPGLGYCVTRQGVFEAAFNVGAGLFLIYLFIFSDVFFVIMNMPLTRNFPLKEPHGGIMIFGIFIVLCLNSAVLTWLGVVAGQIVISNCGSFFDVLNTSLSVFIVLQIDDETMPFTRWWIEERGFVDKKGNLTPEQLDRLTHGSQYYKPGYGHNWLRKLQDPSRIVRFLPIPLILLSLAIVVVPAAVTIIYAALTIQVCPDSPLTPH